ERLRRKKEEDAGIFAVLQEVWANRKARRRQEAYTRHYDFVSKGVVELILQFVEQVVRYRAYTGCLIPSKLFRQWKAQFITGKPFQQAADIAEDQDTLVDLDHAEEELDEMSLLEYQELRGEWSISQVGRMETQPLPDADMQLTLSHCIEWRTGNLNANSNGMPVLNFESMTTDSNPVFDWVINRLKQLAYPPPNHKPFVRSECASKEYIANASCSSIHRFVSFVIIQGQVYYEVEVVRAEKELGCTFRPDRDSSGGCNRVQSLDVHIQSS
ncbi:sperm flagellar protein 2, partial [Clonorchis sinensis]